MRDELVLFFSLLFLLLWFGLVVLLFLCLFLCLLVPVRAAIPRGGNYLLLNFFCYVVFAVLVCFFLSVLLFVLCLFFAGVAVKFCGARGDAVRPFLPLFLFCIFA